jgi:predicted dehydrogenase
MSVRTAILGTGFWAQASLIPALAAQPGATVAAMVDTVPGQAARAAALVPGARPFASLDEAAAAAGPFDLVVIATPDRLHPPMVMRALDHGAAVFCEKPLANDAAAAWSLAAAAEAAARPATVGYSFRYSPALQALRGDIAAGRYGEPWLIQLAEHNPQFHPHAGKPLNWKGDPADAKAGALYEYGSHVVDLALWLLGPVQAVSSCLARVLPGARLDDIATLQMRFACGAAGTLVASWVMAGGFPGIAITLHGAEAVGEVRLDHRLPGGQSYRIGSPVAERLEEQHLAPLEDPRNDASRRHLADLLVIIAGRPGRTDTFPTFREGARAQDVLEASLAADGQWARVDARGFATA